MRYAIVDPTGGIVSNVIVGDDLETVQDVAGPCVLETEVTGPAVIGWVWDGATFTKPEPDPEPAPEE